MWGLAFYSNVENTCMTAFFSLRGEVCTAKTSLPTWCFHWRICTKSGKWADFFVCVLSVPSLPLSAILELSRRCGIFCLSFIMYYVGMYVMIYCIVCLYLIRSNKRFHFYVYLTLQSEQMMVPNG
jgi:hypothetical protein